MNPKQGQSAGRAQPGCVFIVGFMASGKTSVGQMVARDAGARFVDTDQLIEEREGRSIPDIFAQSGEPYFRKVEASVLREVTKACTREKLVVATGGGICTEANLMLMKQHGTLFFLRVPVRELAARVAENRSRPLGSGRSRRELKQLYRNRLPLYLRADYTVDNSPHPPETAAERILDILRETSGAWSG
jgi:shikimate kinase